MGFQQSGHAAVQILERRQLLSGGPGNDDGFVTQTLFALTFTNHPTGHRHHHGGDDAGLPEHLGRK